MLFLQPLVAVACGPTAQNLCWVVDREKGDFFLSLIITVQIKAQEGQREGVFCRGNWAKDQIWALVVGLERFFGLMEHATHGYFLPQVLTFDPKVSVSPVALSWWTIVVSLGKQRCPGRLGLGRQVSQVGRTGLYMILTSLGYPWLVCNFCWELQDKNARSDLFRVVSARQVRVLGSL